MKYIKTGEVSDKFTENLDNEVFKVKNNEDWRLEYMTLLMRDNEMRAEGEMKLASLITKMIADGLSDKVPTILNSISEREKMYEKYNI